MEQASVAMEPAGAPKALTMVLAVVMSIFLAVMLAFVFEYTDQSFKSPEDVERGLGIPFLGGVLKKARPDGYQNVSEQVYLVMKDKKLQTLLMTSFKAGEGVTTVTHNIGKYIAANLGHKVLIVDANPRHLSGKKKDKTSAAPGLFEVLEGKAEFSKTVKNKGEGLFFLPAGNTELNPGILLVTHRMAEVLKEAKVKYDLIIIDADSIAASKDALELAGAAEATVLIFSAGRARRQAAKTAIDTLKERKANILGGILNNRVFSIPGFVYERI
jgi:capsular exopolysaccharide synthesis family protein